MAKISKVFSLIILLFIFCRIVYAQQYIQQGDRLLGGGYVGKFTMQGNSVSISKDGNTALVGARGDDGFIGAVWAFKKANGVWTQMGNKLVGSGSQKISNYGINQGTFVSLSQDGKIAIVGGNNDNGGNGAFWTFTSNGTIWDQVGNKITPTGIIGNETRFGVSGKISSNGKIAIIGGTGDSPFGNINRRGAAWVFSNTGGNWTQMGKLMGVGLITSSGFDLGFGSAVDISDDGQVAIVGAPGDSLNKGSIFIFSASGANWIQIGNKITCNDCIYFSTTVGVKFGSSLSISGDGKTILAGGPSDNNSFGAVWVFTSSGNNWNQAGRKLVGSDAEGYSSSHSQFIQQGWSTSLSII